MRINHCGGVVVTLSAILQVALVYEEKIQCVRVLFERPDLLRKMRIGILTKTPENR